MIRYPLKSLRACFVAIFCLLGIGVVSVAQESKSGADADSGWQACQTAPTVACLTARVLDLASATDKPVLRDTLYLLAIKVQVAAGDLKGSLDTLPRIQRPDETAVALAEIAMGEARSGNSNGARIRFEQALEATKEIENPLGVFQAHFAIAAAQAATGDVAGALRTMDRADPAWFGVFIFETRAEYLESLSGLISARAGADALLPAIDHARKVWPETSNPRGQVAIAMMEAMVGKVADAVVTAKGIKTPYEEAIAKLAVGSHQTGKGDRAGARESGAAVSELIRQLGKLEEQVDLWAALGLLQHSSGDAKDAGRSFKNATETAKQIADPDSRQDHLARVAYAMMHVDPDSEARATFPAGDQGKIPDYILRDLGFVVMRQRDSAAAFPTINSILNAYVFAQAVAGMACIESERGARELANRAAANAKHYMKDSKSRFVVRPVAIAQAMSGDTASAVEVALRIDGPAKQAVVLVAVAAAMLNVPKPWRPMLVGFDAEAEQSVGGCWSLPGASDPLVRRLMEQLSTPVED